MRKITLGSTLVFVCLLSIAITLCLVTTRILLGSVPLGDFRGVSGLVVGILFLYIYSIVLYRLFVHMVPLKEGPLAQGSRDEFNYHVYLLFYLILFQPLTRSLFLPVPLMRLIYLALGARLGENTYSAGVILDPPLTQAGRDCIIGHDAVLFSHAAEGQDLALAAIRIGDNVTIGAKAVIMPGVTIGDRAIVAVSAVVLKGTKIGPDEVWAGIPARRITRSGGPVDHDACDGALTPESRTVQFP